MKLAIVPFFIGLLLLTATSSVSAQISINLGINPCGYPPAYQACPYYGAPVGVYMGDGNWGGDRGRRGGRDGGRGHRGEKHR